MDVDSSKYGNNRFWPIPMWMQPIMAATKYMHGMQKNDLY